LLKGYVICDEDKSTVAVTQIFTTETAETAIVSEINLNISIPFVETATSSSPNAIHSTSRPIASTTDKETEIHLSTFSNTTVSTVSLDTPISTSLPDEKITDHESENFCSTKNTENLNSSITMLNGDVIVTFILSNNENLTSSILFMVNHIKSIDLLSYNISLGEFSFISTICSLLQVRRFEKNIDFLLSPPCVSFYIYKNQIIYIM
jgi:hypothetical protein